LWPELACGQVLEGAKACAEILGRQAALAVEFAQKIFGRAIALLRVAVQAAGDQIAVGVAPTRRLRHDVIQTVDPAGDLPQTVKANAAFAGVDGLAQVTGSHEIRLDEVDERLGLGGGSGSVDARGADFTRQPHLHQVAEVAAFDQAQSSFMDQPAHRRAHAFAPNAHIVGEPQNRKAKTGLALEAAVPKKMRIDRAVEDREFEARRENVFQFFAHF